jgi:hypothetical protein
MVKTEALDKWVEFFRDFMPNEPKSMSEELWVRDLDFIKQAAKQTGYQEVKPRYFRYG